MGHLLCASMPRSGHHLLQRLLKSVLGDRFGYCEYYTKRNCCGLIPCIAPDHLKQGTDQLFMQKSHDRRGSDPLIVPGTLRLVQYRGPVPRVLSDYELHLAGSGEDDNSHTFRWFLVNQALYTIRFYEKWLMRRRPGFFLLSYEQLTGDPTRSVGSLLDFVEVEVDEARLPHQVSRACKHRSTMEVPFSLKDVYAHRYASLSVLHEYESLVLKYSPGYCPLRYFSANSTEPSVLEYLYQARHALEIARPKEAIEKAKLALEIDRDDPNIPRLIETALQRLERRSARDGEADAVARRLVAVANPQA